MQNKVIIVDDDKNLLEVLKDGLSEDFEVMTFQKPQSAKKYLNRNSTDAIIMDYHIPGEDTFNMFHELKGKNNNPILFLTGDACPNLKVKGLDLGVDDFLHKPISMPELKAYLKNRIKSYSKRKSEVVKLQNLEINLKNPRVTVNDQQVILTKKEFQILAILVQNVNTMVKKTDMIEEIWPNVTVEGNNLDTHLSNLRKKLTGFTGTIKTVKCFGYCLKVDVPRPADDLTEE